MSGVSLSKVAMLSGTLQSGGDMETVMKLRADKEKVQASLQAQSKATAPLKWVNRVIQWCEAHSICMRADACSFVVRPFCECVGN